MRRSKSRLKRRPLSMTPLIDIIFLLLLFFMLSSTFTRFAEIPLAQGGRGVPLPSDGADPEQIFLRLNGDEIQVLGAGERAAPLRAYVTGETTTLPSGLAFEGVVALMTLGPDVSSQLFAETLARAQAIPGLTVTVLR